MMMVAVIVGSAFFVGCSSDEPTVSQNEGTRTDSVADDTTDVDSASTIRWIDTISPTYMDEYVPYSGNIEPLSSEIRPVFTKGKKWLEWDIWEGIDEGTYNKALNYTYDYTYDVTDSLGVTNAMLCRDGKEFWRFKEEGSCVYAYNLKSEIVGYDDSGAGILKYWREYDFCYDVDINFTHKFINSYCNAISDGIIAESRGTMVLMGKTRRAVKIIYDNGYDYGNGRTRFLDYWVEGIGSLFGNLFGVSLPISGMHNRYHILLECWEGNEKIYDHREFSHDLYTPTEVYFSF